MALTNYRAYKWLIFLLDEAPDQEYGMTLDAINQVYEKKIDEIYNLDIYSCDNYTSARLRKGITEKKTIFNKHQNKTTTLTYKTFLNWRNAIWKEFGLIIWHPEVKGVAKNSYILVNSELLDENKTLRDTIIHLAEDEQRGYQSKSPFTTSNRGRKQVVQHADTSMGFVSIGNNKQFGYQEEPEMVELIQFAMTIGEGLVVKHISHHSPMSQHTNDNDRFVFEPQQLVQVKGRWYAAGDLYEYGDKETVKAIVCDVDRLRLSQDENVVAPRYTIKEGFSIYNYLPLDWADYFNPDKVISMYLKVSGNIFERTPFCQAQEELDINVGLLNHIYKVWLKPNNDFYIQYMSYGDEVRVIDTPEGIQKTPVDITEEQIVYLKELRKQGLK